MDYCGQVCQNCAKRPQHLISETKSAGSHSLRPVLDRFGVVAIIGFSSLLLVAGNSKPTRANRRFLWRNCQVSVLEGRERRQEWGSARRGATGRQGALSVARIGYLHSALFGRQHGMSDVTAGFAFSACAVR